MPLKDVVVETKISGGGKSISDSCWESCDYSNWLEATEGE